MWLFKNYSIFWRIFCIGMILSSSWVKLNKKVKKEICHPGSRTQAKKSNDFQKMISVGFRLTIAALCFKGMEFWWENNWLSITWSFHVHFHCVFGTCKPSSKYKKGYRKILPEIAQPHVLNFTTWKGSIKQENLINFFLWQ